MDYVNPRERWKQTQWWPALNLPHNPHKKTSRSDFIWLRKYCDISCFQNLWQDKINMCYTNKNIFLTLNQEIWVLTDAIKWLKEHYYYLAMLPWCLHALLSEIYPLLSQQALIILSSQWQISITKHAAFWQKKLTRYSTQIAAFFPSWIRQFK